MPNIKYSFFARFSGGSMENQNDKLVVGVRCTSLDFFYSKLSGCLCLSE